MWKGYLSRRNGPGGHAWETFFGLDGGEGVDCAVCCGLRWVDGFEAVAARAGGGGDYVRLFGSVDPRYSWDVILIDVYVCVSISNLPLSRER